MWSNKKEIAFQRAPISGAFLFIRKARRPYDGFYATATGVMGARSILCPFRMAFTVPDDGIKRVRKQAHGTD
ncbi:hypothetical protein AWH49_16545 [Domibacillus aminovorans]|uniref:Uncharacterized protein n=1 Tax=Domibacillus aminovorans TaxID=29332 RepID=A0A177L448_9BACI|nr:hypothetical protein AWH49_16545 [Domibacillus aminovorans]